MARHRHKIRQKHRIFPRRCTNQMHLSLGKYLVTILSSQIDDSALDGFWKHSVLAAVSARLIAKKMNYHSIEEAYLAGVKVNSTKVSYHLPVAI